MKQHSEDEEKRLKQKALERLGSDHPRCVLCGEGDWRCLELHHLAGRSYDETAVILCRNCHRKQSDPANNTRAPTDPPLLERIAQFLLGLATFLAMLATKLKECGSQLLEAAKVCPPPWGWSAHTAGAG